MQDLRVVFEELGRDEFRESAADEPDFEEGDRGLPAGHLFVGADYKKYGKLSVKMSIIASLMIVVIFL